MPSKKEIRSKVNELLKEFDKEDLTILLEAAKLLAVKTKEENEDSST